MLNEQPVLTRHWLVSYRMLNMQGGVDADHLTVAMFTNCQITTFPWEQQCLGHLRLQLGQGSGVQHAIRTRERQRLNCLRRADLFEHVQR